MKKLLLLGLLLVSCDKPSNCIVSEVRTIKEIRIDSTFVQREYLIILECY